MVKSNTYEIRTLPFWYQRSWAVIAFIILGILFLTGSPYLLYRYRLQRERQKRQRAEEQLKTVQSQLNPHFVYNALSSIEGLITNNENDRANEYLSSFSDIMRDTFRNSDVLFISLAQDLEMLEKYICLEQLRFEFRYEIFIDSRLDPHAIEFPPMFLQPVVENAVKHGVAGMRNMGIISIAIKGKEKDLEITIKDNGIKQNKKSVTGNGYGMQLTKERIEHLKKIYKKENISFCLNHRDNGTTVVFQFENWIKNSYEDDHH